MAVLIVGGALLRVGQDLVGFLGLLEFALRLPRRRDCDRDEFHRQAAIGLLDFGFRGVLRNIEHFVVVALGHSTIHPPGYGCRCLAGPASRRRRLSRRHRVRAAIAFRRALALISLLSLTSSNSASSTSSPPSAPPPAEPGGPARRPDRRRACGTSCLRQDSQRGFSASLGLLLDDCPCRRRSARASDRTTAISMLAAIGARRPCRPGPSAPSRSVCTRASALLRDSTSSRKLACLPRRAPRRRCTMRLISSSLRPLEALMTIFCSLPVALSFADTLRMPLASMSKETSICGMPRGAGGMSARSKRPSDLLSAARSRSPCSTWMVTARLVVVRGREGLRRLGRNRGVLLDQLGHHAAQRLDAERQRRHVEQQHVLDFAGQHAALDRGADGHGFIGVHVLARLLAEEILHVLLHQRHARLATDQDDLGDVLAPTRRHPSARCGRARWSS